VERDQGVREDYKSKVLYHFKPLLQVFRGPPVVHFDNLGVCGTFFDFSGSVEQKG
jgi:hypothetical protein